VHTRRALTAGAAVAALAATAVAGVPAAGADTAAKQRQAGPHEVLVLAEDGASAAETRRAIEASGGRVVDVNKALGLYTVRTSARGFAAEIRTADSVAAAAKDRAVGYAPGAPEKRTAVEEEHVGAAHKGEGDLPGTGPTAGMDPLDEKLWGLEMVRSDFARTVNPGDDRVRVGILDSGIDVRNPDLAEQVDVSLSRNFVTDIPQIDGPCEFDGCKDPATWDDSGHGTHVAGTVAAAADGFGLSGVAPGVTLVNIRGGQDSGYLFLEPVAAALTYGADVGLDVINMSFYVDPWLYNCIGGAPEDDDAAAAHQEMIIKTMERALRYAHRKGVTLVGSLGNNHEDLSNPRVDGSSPDYPPGEAYDRTIDDRSCFDLPVEGPYVLGVSALGPSERKADYSNYSTGLERKQEIEVSAPGGWFRDGLGTPSYRTNENLILSSYPVNAAQHDGLVDEAGNVTPAGVAAGVIKECPEGAASYTECGYYAYLQGTSMASPHATGVAALAVSEWGKGKTADRFGLSPNKVRRIVMNTARDHACPPGGVQSYTDVGRSEEFTATCNGSQDFNAFYGDGIVDAYGAVTVGPRAR
jgi:subtilisin family serine protease